MFSNSSLAIVQENAGLESVVLDIAGLEDAGLENGLKYTKKELAVRGCLLALDSMLSIGNFGSLLEFGAGHSSGGFLWRLPLCFLSSSLASNHRGHSERTSD